MSFSEWKVITFQESGLEIEDGDRGKNYPNKSQLLREGYCPFLNNKNIAGDKLNFEETDFITKEKDQLLRKGKAYRGDIILTTRGSVGNVALFDETIGYEFIRINSGMVIIRNNDLFDLKFLYQQLKSPYMKTQYKNMSTGSAQPQLPIRDIRKLELLLPPLQEQKAIAHILSTLDDKIEVNNQINKTLEDMAQAIFKQWFVDFEFPNEDGEPYKSSGGEMVESELGMIPKGWEIVELCNIVLENRRGFAPSYNKNDIGIPVINQRCIRNHTIIEEAVKYHDNEVKKASENVYHKPFDVLINSMGVGTLGRVSQVSKVEEERIVHSCITILRANKDIIEPIILGHMIKNLEAVIEMMGTGSTGQTSLNNKNLGMLKVVLPPISIQNEISVLLTKFLNKIDQNNIESNKLVQIRDSLLPKLMSGEIRVPLDEEGDVS